MTASPAALSARVRAAGARLGFDLVAVGPAGPPDHGPAFVEWLEAGHAGSMAYLGRRREERLDPARVLPGVRSVIACALNYYQGHQGREAAGPAHVARYAWGDDYHGVMAPRLRALADEVTAAAPGSASRAYVDTGPLLERDLAARAGLGWTGKNTMLIHPRLGSFFFIGLVLTTALLAPDAPLPDRCGTCRRCLDACPTDAFVGARVLDARRCIAYLTIEHRGAIPPSLRPAMGELAFGCDLCQDVCPWNRRAPVTRDPAFRARDLPGLVDLLALEEAAYRRLAGSPLRRAGRSGLRRNAAVALGNGRDAAGLAALEAEAAAGGAAGDPVLAEHVVWARARREAAGGDAT